MRGGTTMDKVFLALFVVFALMRGYDYVAGGQQLPDILGAVGFGLMAFGAWSRISAPADAPQRGRGAFGTFGGGLLVLASFLLRWFG